MKKTLLILSSFIFTTTSISNLNNVTHKLTHKLNNNLQKNLATTIDTNSNNDDSVKLEAWHNSLSIEQDAQAKQAYENAMQITTVKSATSNLDTYNIVFDNAKLQIMLKNNLINQDVYNIFSSPNQSKFLTYEVNAFVNLSTQNNTDIKVRAFQSYFYIQNNKFYFVDKNHPNPNAFNFKLLKARIYKFKTQLIPPIPPGTAFRVLYTWWQMDRFSIAQTSNFLYFLNQLIADGYTSFEIEQWFYELIMDLVIQGQISSDILLLFLGN